MNRPLIFTTLLPMSDSSCSPWWIQQKLFFFFSDPSRNRSASTHAGTPGIGWVPACERIRGCHVPGGDRRGRCWAIACALACGVYVKTSVLMWACVPPLLQRCLLCIHAPSFRLSVATSWSNRIANRICVLFSFMGLVAPTGLRVRNNLLTAILWPLWAVTGPNFHENGVQRNACCRALQ